MTELLTLDIGGSLSPRAARPGLTARLAEVWPEVEPPLRRFLASLGAQRAELEDIAQEVAARVLDRDVPYKDAADLRRWCFVVARRLWLDEWRRCGRSVELAACLGQQDASAARALSRVEDGMLLEKVHAAVAQLPRADQSALTAPRPSTACERNRLNVARHRARRRLRDVVGPFSIVVWSQGRHPVRASQAVWLPGAVLAASAAIVTATWLSTTDAPRTMPAEVQARIVSVDSGAPVTVARRIPEPERATAPSGPVVGLPPTRTSSSEEAVAVEARGPQATWVGARTHPNDGHQPLVCTSGTLGTLCVDIPPLHPPSARR